MGRRPKSEAEKEVHVDTDIMTLREVAKYLKLNEKTIYEMARRGEIVGFKVGGSWRFKKERIDQWLAELEEKTMKEKREKWLQKQEEQQ